MANSSTTNTAQAPAWVYATDPDEGIVYCLCCHAGTDPQDAFERPNQRNHHEGCNAVVLLASLMEAVGDFGDPCPHCQGKGKIPGSKNWVSQGSVEADCYHCGATGEKHRLDWMPGARAALEQASPL